MLENKRIIVTGCGRGMGEATVLAYVAAGAKVVGMDINQELGAAVITQANANASDRAHFVPVDVANEQNVAEAFQKAVELLGGGLDVLAHPAAIQAASDPSEVSAETWDQMFAVNVRGTMLTNQAAHRHMKLTGGGSIINITSIAAERGGSNNPAYAAAKGGLKQMTKALASDLAPFGIRVNNIGPGYFRTDMTNYSWDDPERRALRTQSTMLGRWGMPADLAGIAVLLASDASSYITGQDFYVDGGWLAKI